MAYLEIHKGRTVVHTPLEDEANSIGRQDGNSIVINDKDVSRQHCVIEKWDGAFSIYDVGSRNGVVVNGERVRRASLKSGDIITLGGTIAKFLDAPLQPVAKPATMKRSGWMTWIAATTAMLATAAVVAWALGLLDGRLTLDDWRNRIGLSSNVKATGTNAAVKSNADAASRRSEPGDVSQKVTEPAAPSRAEPSTDDSRRDSLGADVEIRIEQSDFASRYKSISGKDADAELEKLLGQLVSARFIGKPTHDARGRVQWELPPDGRVLAVIDLQTDGGAGTLATIDAEPALIEAELAGRLTRNESGDGFILRVGVIEVLRALSGGDDRLTELTRGMIGKRIIINPRYAAGSES